MRLWIPLLLAACLDEKDALDTDTPADTESDTDTDVDSDADIDADVDADTDADTDTWEDPCDYDHPVTIPLAWDEVGAYGVSAADLFGPQVGSFSAPLYWDDKTSTIADLDVTAIEVSETTYGTVEYCDYRLSVSVYWSLTTEDKRLAAAGLEGWGILEQWSGPNVRWDSMWTELTADELSFDRLDPSSQLYAGAVVEEDGTLSNIAVDERWDVDANTERMCIRAALDPADVECWNEYTDTDD